MNKKAKFFSYIFLLTFSLLFFIPGGYCRDLQTETPETKEDPSFYHRTLSGKYNLIEEDFDEVPHRATKYDYLKEATEKTRLYSRPDGPEFAIINLQWKNGNIFVNNFEAVAGEIKKGRVFPGNRKNSFFYRLFSDNKNVVCENQFDIPFNLHFDYPDEEIGGLAGGALKKSEIDFTIKVPLNNKSAQKIIFYKIKDFDSFKSRQATDARDFAPDEENREIILGETQF